MTWGRLERSYFFGCTCVRGQTEAERAISAIEEQEDIEFLLRYGSPGRPGCRSFDERLRQQGGVELAVARCVINRIAELVPHGDHSSPNYDWPADLQPLITVGRMSNAGRIQGNHFGLIVIKEHIHLWRHYSRLEQDVDQALEDWLPLPLSTYTRPVSYYKHALDCRCDGKPDSQHPLANGPLINLLVSIEEDLETRGSPPSLVDDLARIGEELEEPFIRAADDGDNPDEFVSDVVYPRIARKLLDERAIRFRSMHAAGGNGSMEPTETADVGEQRAESPLKEDAQRINQSTSNSANAAPAPPVNQDPDDWFGIIKVDCNGVSLPISGPSALIRMQWTQGLHRAEQVLFMVSGPQQGVLEILADIVSLHGTLTIPIPAIAPPAPQTSYIYTYHADPGTWLSVFYIGKGRHLRFRSHLDMIYRRIVEAVPALGVTIARSEKRKKLNLIFEVRL